LKGVINLKVAYDKNNDVVSVYLNKEEILETKSTEDVPHFENRNYEIEEAADLILDMVDLTAEGGNFIGFRVFNASKYYDLELLTHADAESLSEKELKKLQSEKVIAVYDKKGNKLVVDNA